MKALSIRQPWAGLIVAGVKHIENRAWRTRFRGRLLIHAAVGRSGLTLIDIERDHGVKITDELVRLCAFVGGILGSVELVDCVTRSESPWFDGQINAKDRPNWGFVLRDARVLPFRRIAGRLGIFDVPDIATQTATGQPMTGRDGQGQHVCDCSEKINETGLAKIEAH